jgi:adenosyl cobinamide kinase/adenosyl cobinamide phosphate guanylyltransferase
MLTLLIGGARSGKSTLALRLAAGEAEVVFVATAEARDEEMAERIARHRTERPESWRTVEEPLELERALAAAPTGACVVVDCLTLWVANALERLGPEATGAAAVEAAAAAAARPGSTIAVTNEVGLGIVPDNALARAYRDLLGHVNAAWAEAAGRVLLVVAGRTVEL